MENNSVKEQLMMLKAFTARTGVIHDAQMLQLEMWPLFLFGGISNTVSIDTDKRLVTFEVNIKKKPTTKVAEEKRKVLTEWVRSILWDNTGIDLNFKVINYGTKKGRNNSSRNNSKRKSTKASSGRRKAST
jgi:hypothetical protein